MLKKLITQKQKKKQKIKINESEENKYIQKDNKGIYIKKISDKSINKPKEILYTMSSEKIEKF